MVPSATPGQGGHAPCSVVGRYALYDQLAAGGMATVHIGRMMGLAGFSRTVAVKRLHPHLATNQNFVAMLLDEARLVVRVRHPNVVPVLDVVQDGGELLLVMEYVQGEPLNVLLRVSVERGEAMGQRIARSVITGVLNGLHAAHESTDEKGEPLGIVHRDVSPQNVIIGIDGVARVLDFGIAKATGRLQFTRDGELKGKTQYMSPEQLQGEAVDRRTDVYAASVVFWEMLTMRRLFRGATQPEIAYKVLASKIEPPSNVVPDIPPELDAIVMRGLAGNPADRFATARDMAIAIEDLGDLAPSRVTGEWVESKAADRLKDRASMIAAIESSSFQRASLSVLGAARSEPKGGADIPTIIEGAAQRTEPSVPGLAPSTSSGAIPLPPASAPLLSEAPGAPPRGGSKALIAIVAVALLVAVCAVSIAGWVVLRTPRAANGPVTVRTPASSAPSATMEPAQSATPPAIPTPSSSSPQGPASAASSAPPIVHVRPGAVRPPATSKPPRGSCEPPYTLDERGIRIPKPECL